MKTAARLTALLIFGIVLSGRDALAHTPPGQRCEVPRSLACEDFVNSKLSRWERKDEHLQRRLRHACSGNPGAACVSFSAANLSWYDVKEAKNMLQIAGSCALTNVKCAAYVKSRLARHEFNEPNEIEAVNGACSRSASSCVQKACASEKYDCDDKFELLNAARSCHRPCPSPY